MRSRIRSKSKTSCRRNWGEQFRLRNLTVHLALNRLPNLDLSLALFSSALGSPCQSNDLGTPGTEALRDRPSKPPGRTTPAAFASAYR